MFSSNKDKLETLVGRNTTIVGNITAKGTVRVDGRITGNIETDWVVMGEKSLLKGNAVVSGMVIAGRVEGNITAKEIVEVKNKGEIVGDMTTAKLVVIEGGAIEGRIMMHKEGSKVVELSPEKLREVKL